MLSPTLNNRLLLKLIDNHTYNHHVYVYKEETTTPKRKQIHKTRTSIRTTYPFHTTEKNTSLNLIIRRT